MINDIIEGCIKKDSQSQKMLYDQYSAAMLNIDQNTREK